MERATLRAHLMGGALSALVLAPGAEASDLVGAIRPEAIRASGLAGAIGCQELELAAFGTNGLAFALAANADALLADIAHFIGAVLVVACWAFCVTLSSEAQALRGHALHALAIHGARAAMARTGCAVACGAGENWMRSGKLLEVSSASGPRQLAKVALHMAAAIKQFKATTALCSDTCCAAVLRRLITDQYNL